MIRRLSPSPSPTSAHSSTAYSSHQLGCSIGAANSLAKAPLAESAAMIYILSAF
jgi:hypothetical protein